MLANPQGWRRAEIERELIVTAEHLDAYDLLWPGLESAPEGEPLDLGRLIGDDDSAAGGLLRTLAFDSRPLGELDDLINRLKVAGLERRIDTLRRDLETIDPDADSDKYSEGFNQLIALERRRRELRGDE